LHNFELKFTYEEIFKKITSSIQYHQCFQEPLTDRKNEILTCKSALRTTTKGAGAKKTGIIEMELPYLNSAEHFITSAK
jgi:hypothetical protein